MLVGLGFFCFRAYRWSASLYRGYRVSVFSGWRLPLHSTGVRTQFSDLRGYYIIKELGCSAISHMDGVPAAFSGGWIMLRPLYHYCYDCRFFG